MCSATIDTCGCGELGTQLRNYEATDPQKPVKNIFVFLKKKIKKIDCFRDDDSYVSRSASSMSHRVKRAKFNGSLIRFD